MFMQQKRHENLLENVLSKFQSYSAVHQTVPYCRIRPANLANHSDHTAIMSGSE